MKLGTTSIVLRLIEDGHYPESALFNPRDLLSIAHRIGSTASLNTLVQNAEGREVTAIDVQEMLYQQAFKYGEQFELPNEEYEVISQWEEVLQDLRTDPVQCFDRVDWLVNQYIVEAARDDLQLRRKRDLGYTMMLQGPGYGIHRRQDGAFRMTPSQEEVDRALTTPPQDTRAAVRSEAIRTFRAHKIKGAIDWTQALLLNGEETEVHEMEDPYHSDPTQFRTWFQENVGKLT